MAKLHPDGSLTLTAEEVQALRYRIFVYGQLCQANDKAAGRALSAIRCQLPADPEPCDHPSGRERGCPNCDRARPEPWPLKR